MTPVTLTDAAKARLHHLMSLNDGSAKGIRLGVTTQGCSGMSYAMDFTDAPDPAAEPVDADGVTLFVDPTAMMFLVGTEIDYVEDKMHTGFVFNNPNEKGRCGCGSSFHV